MQHIQVESSQKIQLVLFKEMKKNHQLINQKKSINLKENIHYHKKNYHLNKKITSFLKKNLHKIKNQLQYTNNKIKVKT